MMNWSLVPVTYMAQGLQNYIELGIPPGSFLTALLCNDFMEACRKADDTNRQVLFEWGGFLYNELPIGSFGSPDAFDRWIAHRGLAGKSERVDAID